MVLASQWREDSMYQINMFSSWFFQALTPAGTGPKKTPAGG
jgi:hypothetical protein